MTRSLKPRMIASACWYQKRRIQNGPSKHRRDKCATQTNSTEISNPIYVQSRRSCYLCEWHQVILTCRRSIINRLADPASAKIESRLFPENWGIYCTCTLHWLDIRDWAARCKSINLWIITPQNQSLSGIYYTTAWLKRNGQSSLIQLERHRFSAFPLYQDDSRMLALETAKTQQLLSKSQ
jgi:hypothetical protein